MPDPITEEEIQPPETDETTPVVPESPPENFNSLADALAEAVPGIEKLTHTQSTNPKGEKIAEVSTIPPRDDAGKFKATTEPAKPAETAPVTTAPVTTAPVANARDTDLEAEVDPQVRPKTRKVIDTFKGHAVAARNERDAAVARAAEIETKYKDAETKLKTQVAPKEMQDELETLRTRVRELDVSKDPAIEAKYDNRIKSNSTSAMEVLKEQGLFMKSGGDGKPLVEMTPSEAKVLTAEIERAGVGIRGMAKYISQLEKGGEYAAAEQLRALAQHNDRLAYEKTEEISKWAKDYDGLKARRAQEAQSQNTAYTDTVRKVGESTLKADMAELESKIEFLKRPAPSLATDSPEVKAAKDKASAEYDTAIASLAEGVKAFNVDGLPPEKAAEVSGKMSAAAIQSVILKQHVIPRLLKEAAANVARIKELEASESKRRKAGELNRAHSAALNAPADGKRAPSSELSMEEALASIVRENGGQA